MACVGNSTSRQRNSTGRFSRGMRQFGRYLKLCQSLRDFGRSGGMLVGKVLELRSADAQSVGSKLAIKNNQQMVIRQHAKEERRVFKNQT